MTDNQRSSATGLVSLLERARVDAPAPPVEALQEMAHHRRRRVLTTTMVGAAALFGTAAITFGLLTQQPEGGATKIEAVADDPADNPEFDPSTTTSPATPVDETDATDDADATDQTDEQGIGESEPAAGWSILAPDGADWELLHLSSTDWATGQGRDTRYVMTDQGDMGPLAAIWYNVDVDTLDYQDGPRNWVDVMSPGGRTVRLGDADESGRQTAIFVTEVGSAVVSGFDVPEDDLIAMSDTVSAAGVLVVDEERLPEGFALADRPSEASEPQVQVSYTLRQGDSSNLQVRSWPNNGDELSQVWSLRSRDEVWDGIINGNRVLIAATDSQGDQPLEATVMTDDFIYHLMSWPWDRAEGDSTAAAEIQDLAEQLIPLGNADPTTVDGLRRFIEQMVSVGAAEIRAKLAETEDRGEVLDRWITNPGLPDGYDLDWLRDGPPLSASDAFHVYQLLRCAWVLEWADTGDDAILAMFDESGEWPSARAQAELEVEAGGGEGDPSGLDVAGLFAEDMASARAADTEEQRRSSLAYGSCGWAAPAFGR